PFRCADPPPHQRAGLARLQLAQYEQSLRELRVGAGPARALRDLLAAAAADGTPAGPGPMPEGAKFRAAYGPGAGPDLLAFLAGLRAACGAPLIDARTWMPDEAFHDGHHLLPGAAEQFTRRLRAALAEVLHGEGRE